MSVLISILFTTNPLVCSVPTFPTEGLDGAILDFYGVVRGREGSLALSGLQYQAYEEMARHQFQRIIGELLPLYPVSSLELIHRIGFVPVGHPSLFVRVGSPHRQEALRFMEELIARMKQDVPIWKEDVALPSPPGLP